jgi:hypothetical protein
MTKTNKTKPLFGFYGVVTSDQQVAVKKVAEIVADIRRYKKQNAGKGIIKGNDIQSLFGPYKIASKCYAIPTDAQREAKYMAVANG